MLLKGYPVLFLLLIFGALTPFLLMGLAQVLMFKTPTGLKYTTYESGMKPFGDARIQFDIKFYLYALLFILFDIESVFLFPWAVVYSALGLTGLMTMLIFLGILVLGLVYAWRKGALQWQ